MRRHVKAKLAEISTGRGNRLLGRDRWLGIDRDVSKKRSRRHDDLLICVHHQPDAAVLYRNIVKGLLKPDEMAAERRSLAENTEGVDVRNTKGGGVLC